MPRWAYWVVLVAALMVLAVMLGLLDNMTV